MVENRYFSPVSHIFWHDSLGSDDEDENGVVRPKRDFPGGSGTPLEAKWAGRAQQLRDGCGLNSSGRWHPSRRRVPDW